MSAIDALGGLGSGSSATPNGFADLTSDEFIQIIFTELQNQDPLEPQDSSALLDQLSSLRDIEADLRTTESFESLVAQNELAAATTLIGSLVSGVTASGRRVADLVISVSVGRDGPLLNLLDGSILPFDRVDEIVGPLDFGDDTDGGGGGDSGDGGSGGGGGDSLDRVPNRADGDPVAGGDVTGDEGTRQDIIDAIIRGRPIDPGLPVIVPRNTAPGGAGDAVGRGTDADSGGRLQELINAHRNAVDAWR